MRKKKINKALTAHNSAAALQPTEEKRGRVLPQRSEKKKALPPDPYYTILTKRARVLRYISVFVLVAFTVLMAFVYSEEITGEKLKLLVRNASFSFPGENISFTTVRFDADTTMDFASYRTYFAVATSTGVRLYDHRGSIALNERFSAASPVLDAGSDFFLIYDKEGRDYMICNSVSQLHAGSETYPIYFADVADNGSYMIVTSSSSYLCEIKFFNRSFNPTRIIRLDRYPLYAQFADNASRALLVSLTTSDDGRAEGHVTVYEMNADKAAFDYISGDMPLHAALRANGGAVILYSNRFVYISSDGKEEKTIHFESGKPAHYTVGEGYFAVDLELDAVKKEHRIVVFDQNDSEKTISFAHTGRIDSLTVVSSKLFICGEDPLAVFSLESGKESTISGKYPVKILKGVNETIFFCYKEKADNVKNMNEIKDLQAPKDPKE